MRFDEGIAVKYRKSVDDALETIFSVGNEFHKRLADRILSSEMLVRVLPVSEVNASGITGLVDAGRTNDRIASERVS